jgi:hypothetical protein
MPIAVREGEDAVCVEPTLIAVILGLRKLKMAETSSAIGSARLQHIQFDEKEEAQRSLLGMAAGKCLRQSGMRETAA